MMFQSHFLSMAVYAVLTALVMAVIRRRTLKERIRYGLTLFIIMVGGALLFGWFMLMFIRK